MAKKPSKKPAYKLTLQLGKDTYTSQGISVLDALSKLERPSKIMIKGILTLESTEGRFQQLFYPTRLKRLFYGPSMQSVQAKQLLKVMKPI